MKSMWQLVMVFELVVFFSMSRTDSELSFFWIQKLDCPKRNAGAEVLVLFARSKLKAQRESALLEEQKRRKITARLGLRLQALSMT